MKPNEQPILEALAEYRAKRKIAIVKWCAVLVIIACLIILL